MIRGVLKQLNLGGFQVFDKKTAIPFGPLTLIFGPNSAGKSTILDALEVLHKLLSLDHPGEMTHPLYGQAKGLIDRHWRTSGSKAVDRSASLTLGVFLDIDLGVPAAIVNDPRFSMDEWAAEAFYTLVRPHAQDRATALELELSYVPATQPAPDDLTVTMKLAVLGSRFMDIEPASVCVYLDHLMVKAAVGRNLANELTEIAPEHFSVVGDSFRITPMVFEGAGVSLWEAKEALARRAERSSDKADAELLAIEAFINSCFRGAAKVVRDALSLHVVPASRVVPSARSLTYLFDSRGIELDGESFGLALDGSAEFRGFAAGALRARLQPWSPERVALLNEPFGPLPPGFDPTADLDRLNRLLSEHLFRERGYFVSGAIHELRPIGGSGTVGTNADSSSDSSAFLVRLLLVDADGRRLKFEEVGSGLGYALPVLAAISRDRFAFIQQPELHLHPALQSELGDGLIAALAEGDLSSYPPPRRQYIIETHSEHLLLRLLRRVREATHGSLNPDAPLLERDSLVVLYVDPQADGSSTVRRLRISHDGEFMDRWPRGFFEERWKDLFDE
jgi:hypothetical protein